MSVRAFRLILPLACLCLMAPTVRGGMIANGDFSISGPNPAQPFASWSTDLGFGDPPTDGGGFAQLEVEGLASDLLIDAQQLQQTFSLSASAAKLSFEFSLTTSGTLAPSGTPDSFQVALLDSSGVPLLSTTGPFYSIDNDGTPFLDSGKVDVTDLAGGVRRVQLDVSGIPAQDVTIFFLLTADPFGRHDGLTTTVALDNVVLDSAAVPEPSSLAIMMVGVAIGGIAVGRSRRTGR